MINATCKCRDSRYINIKHHELVTIIESGTGDACSLLRESTLRERIGLIELVLRYRGKVYVCGACLRECLPRLLNIELVEAFIDAITFNGDIHQFVSGLVFWIDEYKLQIIIDAMRRQHYQNTDRFILYIAHFMPIALRYVQWHNVKPVDLCQGNITDTEFSMRQNDPMFITNQLLSYEALKQYIDQIYDTNNDLWVFMVSIVIPALYPFHTCRAQMIQFKRDPFRLLVEPDFISRIISRHIDIQECIDMIDPEYYKSDKYVLILFKLGIAVNRYVSFNRAMYSTLIKDEYWFKMSCNTPWIGRCRGIAEYMIKTCCNNGWDVPWYNDFRALMTIPEVKFDTVFEYKSRPNMNMLHMCIINRKYQFADLLLKLKNDWQCDPMLYQIYCADWLDDRFRESLENYFLTKQRPFKAVGNGECPICYCDGELVETICGHKFHVECINNWHSLKCPYCRGMLI